MNRIGVVAVVALISTAFSSCASLPLAASGQRDDPVDGLHKHFVGHTGRCPPNSRVPQRGDGDYLPGVSKPTCACDEGFICFGPKGSDGCFEDEPTGRHFNLECTSCGCMRESSGGDGDKWDQSVALTVSQYADIVKDDVVLILKHSELDTNRKTCIVPHACMASDNDGNLQVVLPHWLHQYRDLMAGCFPKDADYTLGDGTPFVNRVGPMDDQGQVANFSRYDLLGIVPVRNWHFPHFMTDMLWLLPMFDMVQDMSPHRAYCISEQGQHSASCSPKAISDLKPAMLGEVTFSDNWSASFLDLMFAEFDELPLITSRLRPGETRCFNRVISGHQTFHAFSPRILGPDSYFFSRNDIKRTPRRVHKPSIRGTTSCQPHIVLLNRPETVGRGFMNINTVISTLKRVLAEFDRENRLFNINGTGELMAIEPAIDLRTFDDATLRDQIDVMQSADVFLSAHGAANTNYIFLRPESVAIEIFPFGYSPPQFRQFAKLFGAHYVEAKAGPDPRPYFECIDGVLRKHTPEQAKEAKESLKKDFEEMTRILEEQGMDKVPQYHPHSTDSQANGDKPFALRQCLRQQRIILPSREIVKLLLQATLKVCNAEEEFKDLGLKL